MTMASGASRALLSRAGLGLATPSLFKSSSSALATPSPTCVGLLPPLTRRARGSVRALTPCFSSNSICSFSHVSHNARNRRGTFCTAAECAPSPSSVAVDSAAPAEAAEVGADLDLLDIRVGKILKAWKHPEADSLYVEEVDVGEPEGPRTICSGLVKYVPEEALEGRAVVVFANLKPRNMRGVKSNGMLLCASDASHEHIELLTPPEGATPGDRIWFGSEDSQANQKAAGTPNQIQKKKIWESIQPHLKTTDDCAAVFQERPMRVASGIITCESLKGGNIS